MVSLKHKRNENVYNSSSDEEESDFEVTYKTCNFNNNQSRKNKGRHDDSYDLNTEFKSKFATKKAKFSSTDSEKRIYETGRRPKAYNRNALMARENRIKKKIYVQNLEETVEKVKDENKKLSSILNNQSTVISDLRKEVKYLKNVLTNSTDISKLLKSINQNISLPVTTSISNNINITTTKEASRNFHPWAEDPKHITEWNDLKINSNWNDLFLPETIDEDCNKITEEEDLRSIPAELDEHNYTNNPLLSKNDDAGVCLHIARHKVSLEFCASCSENATMA